MSFVLLKIDVKITSLGGNTLIFHMFVRLTRIQEYPNFVVVKAAWYWQYVGHQKQSVNHDSDDEQQRRLGGK